MIWKLICIVGVAVFLYSFLIYFIRDWQEERVKQKIDAEIEDFNRLKDRIRNLNKTFDQIEQIENLLTDIEICDPKKLYKNFTLSWNGKEKYDFLSDGDSITTDSLRQLAMSEHERLCTSLSEQIADLYSTVVTESVTESVADEQERGVDAA